jgi:4-amino-4-deoxy-L-arabinose transferase-like glycosyltransferase
MKSIPMKLPQTFHCWYIIVLIGLITGFYIWGIRLVPFHPDESTYLFMSSDFDLLIHDPFAMAWNPELDGDQRQRYRELDAPLTRYILGFGRSLSNIPALSVDWDWSKTWQQNQEAGAVPGNELLFTGRLAVTLLLPLSLALIYFTGKAIGNRFAGLLAVFLFGSNALILLHTRRAMAEGALVFGVTLSLWSFIEGDRRPWLSGLAVALAFCAKQSALALLPAGIFAVGWVRTDKPHWIGKSAVNIVQYLGAFVLLTLALNPLYWSNPIKAVQRSWEARNELLGRQTRDALALAPEQILQTPGKRAAAFIANLFIVPPSFAEVGNYSEQTAISERNYLSTPGYDLGRGLAGGSVLLFMTLTGILISGLKVFKFEHHQKHALLILIIATAFQAMALLIAVPLPWQRYVIPLVPFVCIWIAYGLMSLLALFKEATGHPHRTERTILN